MKLSDEMKSKLVEASKKDDLHDYGRLLGKIALSTNKNEDNKQDIS